MNFLTIDGESKELFQWDTGRTATVTLENINEVHFSNLKYGKSYDMAVEGGKVEIPPEVLQTGEAIYCWAYVGTVSSGCTYTEQFFTVNKRPKPADYVYTPTEITTIENAVNKALEEAKASGDFKGEKGDKGDKGEQGEKGEKGDSITVDDEMSDKSTNPVENKVAKAYVDKNAIKTITEPCNAWELDSGVYVIQLPEDAEEPVYIAKSTWNFEAYTGLLIVVRAEFDIDGVLVYYYGFDPVQGPQNILSFAVDYEGNEKDEYSLGFFKSPLWVDDRLSALESAIADLGLGE